MNTMRNLIQLTTTATLAACLQVSTIGIANAARPTSNSTSRSTSTVLRVAQTSLLGNQPPTSNSTNRSTSTVVTVARTSLLGNQPHKYEPDPNGNPKSDGTGTR